MTQERMDKVVEAIYKAEGGYKAKYLYGIQSVKYKDAAEARRLCLQSVANNHSRWITSKAHDGKPESFVKFMAKRYCPHNQRVWTKNVMFYWKKFDKEIK